ncbi:MAG: class IV adenylate cyclase [Spirochaetia bacterium]
MALEIEVKCWIDDPDEIRDRFDKLFTPVGEYSKYDTYFRFPLGDRFFRLRSQGDSQIVTLKAKTVHDGVEVNEETEFTVSDREKFIKFIRDLGCNEYIEKVKTSRVYRDNDLTVELSHVKKLGWFVEIEKLTDETISTEERKAVRERLLRRLDDLGIGRERVEGRYYMDMLAERLMKEKERT